MGNSGFFDKNLLETNYFKKYKQAYDKYKKTGDPIWYNMNRNYQKLLDMFCSICDFNKQHAMSFSKRIKAQDKDWKSCEAIYAEMLVYYFYLKLYYEGFVKSIQLIEPECDLIVERSDNTKMYMEVFCVMPDVPIGETGNPIVYDVKTHTQKSLSSIRQKVLQKIKKQNQLVKSRENYLIIELNDISIAGDFSILSSLSDGYKVTIDKKSMEVVSGDYDWSESVFDNPETKNIKAVIYFRLGSYETRKIVINPNYNA